MTLRACTLISDTKCGLKEERKNSTEDEVDKVDKEEVDEDENKEEDGVLVYEAKDNVEKGPPAFGKEKDIIIIIQVRLLLGKRNTSGKNHQG